jgi:hypothetical protein
MREAILNNQDHKNWDRWIGSILDHHAAGKLSRQDAVLDIGQVIGAVDIGNIGEFQAWVSGRNDRTR